MSLARAFNAPTMLPDKAPQTCREVSPPPHISTHMALDRVFAPIPPRPRGVALPPRGLIAELLRNFEPRGGR